MECNFGKNQGINEGVVSIEGQKNQRVNNFDIQDILHAKGDIGADVTHRIKAGWTKWRNASGVLCDQRIPLRLKEKFYKTAIRPAMLYGTECWAVKNNMQAK